MKKIKVAKNIAYFLTLFIIENNVNFYYITLSNFIYILFVYIIFFFQFKLLLFLIFFNKSIFFIII